MEPLQHTSHFAICFIYKTLSCYRIITIHGFYAYTSYNVLHPGHRKHQVGFPDFSAISSRTASEKGGWATPLCSVG